MTDGVTKQYELTGTRAVLLDVISSNITDPLTGDKARSSTTHWIFAGNPNPADLGKPAPQGWKFPIVVLEYPQVDTENMTVDGSKQSINHSVIIRTRSRTRSEAHELAEQVKYILEVTANPDLRCGTLHGPDINGTSMDNGFIGGNKFYGVAIDYEFKRFD